SGSGPNGGTMFAKKVTDPNPALTLQGFTPNQVYSSPLLSVKKPDNTTDAVTLNQTGIGLASSIKWTGAQALSGFGGSEITTDANYRLQIPSATMLLFTDHGNTPYAHANQQGGNRVNSTIRWTGARALSGFGGSEITNVANYGLQMASANYGLFAANGTTPYL